MVKPFLIAAALLASTPAYAQIVPERDYRIHDELQRKSAMRWETAYIVLTGVDLVQTVSCLKADTCEEANPLVGKHPNTTKLIATRVALSAAHFAFVHRLSRDHPAAALRFAQLSVGVQGAVVGLNFKTLF